MHTNKGTALAICPGTRVSFMRKILLVEDDPTLRKVYRMLLTAAQYQIATAANGLEALGKCKSDTFDLILLDLMMPVLDGVGFLSHFVDRNLALPAKIIVLSNLSSGQELARARTYGATKSLLKADLSPSQLLDVVRQELEA
jgi:CheY-like chemotaxis protein